ncbi:MAG TPA: hypothetical protein VK524_03485 [Polyangiaceae bacterium]|nr:hypothetical protein [Polyangiaceae bacterium]
MVPLALGPSESCVDNPCDPYCQRFVDDPSGLDAGADSGLNIQDSGISLVRQIGSDAGVRCTGLTITPATQTLTVTSLSPLAPSTLTFSAQLTPAGCYTGAVPAVWTHDQQDLATLSSTGVLQLVTPVAGPIQIKAYVGAFQATATASVVIDATDVSQAPSGYTAASFNGSTSSDTLNILYPYASTVFPLGLPSPLVQWATGANGAANAAKVTLRYPATGTATFTWSAIRPESQAQPTPSLPAQPRADIPQNVWFAFENTAVGNDASFSVQRIVSGTVRTAVSRTIRFATGQLKGTVYYNSYGTNLVKNYEYTAWGQRFGAATLAVQPGATAPVLVAGATSTGTSGTGCRVCHSVAANGTRLITNRFTPNDWTSTMYDLSVGPAAETLMSGTNDGRFSWPALSPDGSFLFSNAGPPRGGSSGLQGSDNGALTSKLYSVPAGAQLSTVDLPTTLKAATPVFSPDGTNLAFNFYAGTSAPLANVSLVASGNQRSLASMSMDPATKRFSNFRVLHTPSLYNLVNTTAVWPSFLPTGQDGIVFERELVGNGRDFGGTRSTCDGSGSCADAGTRAELWWVSTGLVPNAQKLTNLNGVGLPTNSAGHASDQELNYEPTVNPQVVGGYSWVVFTSRRLYGNVATINPFWSDPRYKDLSAQPTPKKLWVAAVGQNPTPGSDPSYPAFYLPGQELLAGNSRGYWVLDACRPASNTLSAANRCETDLDCCNAPGAATCRLDPPPLTNPPASHCVPLSTNACVPDGQTCTSDAQCCNFGTGSRCESGTCVPPPPAIFYPPAVFTRDYEATCPPGRFILWRFFEWQSTTPTGTSISFHAASADTLASLPAATLVGVGTAQPPPVTTPTWASGPRTIDEELGLAGEKSRKYLRITAALNPSASPPNTPTLTNWRVNYSCPFAE